MISSSSSSGLTCFGTVWPLWCWCAVKLWYNQSDLCLEWKLRLKFFSTIPALEGWLGRASDRGPSYCLHIWGERNLGRAYCKSHPCETRNSSDFAPFEINDLCRLVLWPCLYCTSRCWSWKGAWGQACKLKGWGESVKLNQSLCVLSFRAVTVM